MLKESKLTDNVAFKKTGVTLISMRKLKNVGIHELNTVQLLIQSLDLICQDVLQQGL